LNFQLRDYQDQLLYEVVAMDTCDVCIGRVLMYDRKLYYNTMKNTYQFVKGEKNSLLRSIPDKITQRRIVMSFTMNQ